MISLRILQEMAERTRKSEVLCSSPHNPEATREDLIRLYKSRMTNKTNSLTGLLIPVCFPGFMKSFLDSNLIILVFS